MGSTDYHERRIATKGVERPFVVAEIQTGADIPRRLACQGSSLVWVSGIGDVIEAWSLQDGCCVTDIFKTRSTRRPTDLTVSPKGRVVYSDHYKRKILKWVKGRIKVVLRFKKWRPSGICYTSGGELIVGLSNREYSQKKICRYLGRSLRQEIQYDKEGRSLFIPGFWLCLWRRTRTLTCVSPTARPESCWSWTGVGVFEPGTAGVTWETNSTPVAWWRTPRVESSWSTPEMISSTSWTRMDS